RTIERYVEFFRSLAEGMVADETQLLHRLSMMGPEERRTLLCNSSQRVAECSNHICVHEVFEAQVKRAPDTIAVVLEEESLSYAELNHRANRIAHHLQQFGITSETRVRICVCRSFDMLVGLLAVLKLGGVCVALEPTQPVDRLSLVI